jgi:hypothetical protein
VLWGRSRLRAISQVALINSSARYRVAGFVRMVSRVPVERFMGHLLRFRISDPKPTRFWRSVIIGPSENGKHSANPSVMATIRRGCTTMTSARGCDFVLIVPGRSSKTWLCQGSCCARCRRDRQGNAAGPLEPRRHCRSVALWMEWAQVADQPVHPWSAGRTGSGALAFVLISLLATNPILRRNLQPPAVRSVSCRLEQLFL